ncbi:glycosyltransferase family 2 protein [Candidatus Woesearchaeota archaeon]|nr:glycosyltransferase family 2 protein [Candidatus Woesearchaeota archaeon]
MKLSIIMPVYNEARYIDKILAKIFSVELGNVEKEIIVVDDFSTDGSREKLAELAKAKHEDVRVVLHDRNKGKGSALRTGLAYSTGDIVLFQDADLEYDPQDYEKLIQPIIENRADVVYGSRFLGSTWRNKLALPTHFLGNKILSLLTTLFYRKWISDMETGYKVFRSSVIKGLSLTARRFEIEPEITAKLLKKNVRLCEVPVSYSARKFSEGKKITWKDGVKAAWWLVKCRFKG